MQLYDYETPYEGYRSYDGLSTRRRRNSFYEDEGSIAGGYAQSMSNYRSPSPIPIAGGVSPYGAPVMLPGGSPYGGSMMLPNVGGVSPYASPATLSASPYQGGFYGQPGGMSYDQQQVAMGSAPGTVIIHAGGSDSGHSHRHRHRSRSRNRHHHHHRSGSSGSYNGY
jgi:hypothetical protein